VKTEQHYKEQIAKEIRRIAELEHNKETTDKFWKTLEKIKPKSCIVKSGWRAGDNIDLTLAFEKGGNKNPFDLFIENIPDLIETYGFIYGLWPTIFHFNPITAVSDDDYYFLTFKLCRNE